MRRIRFGGLIRGITFGAVLLFGLISLAFVAAPSQLVKPLYPLSYETYIKEASAAYGLSPFLTAAVIEVESGWDADALSSRGAEGLMQLLPETAQDMIDKGLVDGSEYSAEDLFDPETNIRFGCAYLRYLLDYFDGSVDQAIAAYNAGMGYVDLWSLEETVLHNAITFPETQAYLIHVLTAYDRYTELYGNSFS